MIWRTDLRKRHIASKSGSFVHYTGGFRVPNRLLEVGFG